MSARKPPPASVLVYVGLDRVGDGLLKMPFVRGLREAFPEARITWVAGKETSVYAGVIAPEVTGLLDEVIETARIGATPTELFRRPLDGRRFDLVIDPALSAEAARLRPPGPAYVCSLGVIVGQAKNSYYQ